MSSWKDPNGEHDITEHVTGTDLDGCLSLDEEALEGVDALLEPVHGDLAAAARGERLRQLGHVRVQLVPAHTQRLRLGLVTSKRFIVHLLHFYTTL